MRRGTTEVISEDWRRAVSLWCKLLTKRGYKVTLMDEHYTSKRCSSCKSSVSECTHDKDWRNTKCNACKKKHNRDKNACLNMLAIVRAHAREEARPNYLLFNECEQVLKPQKSPARKIVHEAKPLDANGKDSGL